MRPLLLALALALAAPAAQAQQLLDRYVALLSWNDHYNSNGQRLTAPWQIIRQDRANFHRYGIRDPQDEWDSIFGSMEARAAAEQLIMNGYMSPAASSAIVNSEVLIVVEIWGYGRSPTYLNIDVWQ